MFCYTYELHLQLSGFLPVDGIAVPSRAMARYQRRKQCEQTGRGTEPSGEPKHRKSTWDFCDLQKGAVNTVKATSWSSFGHKAEGMRMSIKNCKRGFDLQQKWPWWLQMDPHIGHFHSLADSMIFVGERFRADSIWGL